MTRLKYQSGEEIKKGDHVIFHGEPAEIEFVVEGLTENATLDWYMKEFGGGVMIREPKHYGMIFIPIGSLHEMEDLELLSRASN
ncbi:MAG TPA: hypothetical protein VK709_04465 [Candidatus Saccharimonadales bacterium]|jgi:hypothetical protein|nr:hypothetical protein [Candidatus Saccharimonadales bacterium]